MSLVDEPTPKNPEGTPPLTAEQVQALAPEVPGWEVSPTELLRRFRFADFREAMAFVNEVAAVADEANHHPDIEIFYNRVTLRLHTHTIKGLSRNDFVVAARLNRLSGAAAAEPGA